MKVLFAFVKGVLFSAVFAVLPVVFAIMAGRSYVAGAKFTSALTWQLLVLLLVLAVFFAAQIIATLKLSRAAPERRRQSYWTMIGIWSIYPVAMILNIFSPL